LLNSGLPLEGIVQEGYLWAVERFLGAPIASNPTYCHGLAGQLELSMMLQADPEFAKPAANRAERLKRAILLQRRELDGNSFWPSENPEQMTPDLWVGGLGPLVALIRAQNGDQSALLL
jgi:hypothetical protein